MPVVAIGQGISSIISDDFNQFSLDTTVWTYIDPVGDATFALTGTNTANAVLEISLPAGSDHDIWRAGNRAPRIMQSANNTDFEIEVKFESALGAKYQLHGVLVENSPGNFIRFDFYSTGGATYIFAASFLNGSPSVRSNKSITSGQPLYLRVARTGNSWTQSYSYDGLTWQTATTFTHTLAVSSVGTYVGNASGSSSPAHLGTIDYFFNTAFPIVPEDGSSVPQVPPVISSVPVTTALAGSLYTYDINASGEPAPKYNLISGPAGMSVDSITGLLSWSPLVATTVLVVAEAFNSLAADTQSFTLVVDPSPSLVPTIVSTPVTSGIVGQSYLYDVDAVSQPAATYSLVSAPAGMVIDSISGLVSWMPTTSGAFNVTVMASNSAGSDQQVFVVNISAPINSSIILSDDFNAFSLDATLWTITDPVGDGTVSMTGTNTPNAVVTLSVPGGTSHDVWSSGNNGLRIMQAANNTDFEVEVKFESIVSQKYQEQGIIIEQDAGNFLRFDFHSDGVNTKLLAASFTNLAPVIRTNSIILGGIPMYMRVLRQGDVWTQKYSTDGISWTTGVVFTFPIVVTSAGLFTGNAGSNPPAFTCLADYFFNTASPVISEDGAVANQAPILATIGNWSVIENDSIFIAISSVDPEGGSVSLSSSVLPVFGQFIDNGNGSGTLTLRPFSGNFGTYPVTVTATDSIGATASETFVVTVRETTPPTIAVISPAPGGTYSVLPVLSIRTQDNVGIDRAYYQVDGCGGVWNELWAYNSAVNDTTISWTIPNLSSGFHQLYLRTVDDFGNVNIDSCSNSWGFTLNVPFPPTITSLPDTAASVGTPYSLTVISSAEPAASYSLATSPVGMTINSLSGIIDFLPTIGGAFPVTVVATNSQGTTSLSYTLIVETPPMPSTLVSDDFSAPALNSTIWTFVDPIGDASALINGTGTADARVDLTVPPSVDHDVWRAGNNSARLMQSSNDVDFSIEVKFNSGVSLKTQMQGIIVEQDASNFIRFDFLSDGSFTRIFSASFTGLVPNVRKNSVITTGAALYLRLTRTGQNWTGLYSVDGTAWTPAINFTHPLSVTSVGIFAANASGGNSPGHTAQVDYFFNLASPTVPEDGNINVAPVLAVIGNQRVDTAGTLVVNVSASDANGDILTFSSTGIPPFASLLDNGNNTATLTVTPVAGDQGDYPVMVSVADSAGFSDSENFVIQIRETTPPQIAVLSPNSGLSYDNLPVLTINVTDNNGVDRGFYQIDSCSGPWIPLWSYNSLSLDTTVSLQVPVVSSGAHNLYFKAIDDAQNLNGDSCTTVWSFNYLPLSVPVITSTPVSIASPNSAYTYDVQSTGIPAPWYSLLTAPTGMSISSVSGLISWTATVTGNYPVTVMANNSQGVDSQSFVITVAGQKPIVDFWQGKTQQFGLTGTPQRWVNILGTAIDVDGISSLSYTLNGSLSRSLSIGPDNRRLASVGDFNIDLLVDSLITGANTVIVTAVDALGFQAIDTVVVNYAAGNSWPLPYTIDWSTAGSVSAVSKAVDGRWAIQPGGVRPLDIAYDRLLAIGDTSWTNYEVTVPITVHSVQMSTGPLSGSPGVGLLMRWTGHTDSPVAGWQPKSGWEPLGALGWWRWTTGSSASLEFSGTGSGKSFLPAIGVTYMLKLRIETAPGQGALYSLKAWPVLQTEPPAWDVTHQATVSDKAKGSFLLLAHHVDATFGNLTVTRIAPKPSNIQISATDNSATITWLTNEPASSVVDYGLTTTYELGTIVDTALATTHSVALTNLLSSSQYHFKVTVTDGFGNSGNSGDQVFFTNAPDLSGIVSDDFSSPTLNTTLWTIVDPVGDGTVSLTGSGTQNAFLALTVPAGVDHDAWRSGNKSVRIMQAVNNEDFEVEVKFESSVSLGTQMQGIIVEQDATNFIRFDFLSNGTSTRAFSASFVNLSSTLRANRVIVDGNPLYLRVKRILDSWTFTYSYDGLTWLTAVSFSHPMTVSSVGPFVANAAGINSPGHTASVDYFFNTSAPILLEDNLTPPPAAKEENLPDRFALEQNYPNPFNPSTEINFSLPVASQVRLDVYNLLGQLVVTLRDGGLPAGRHSVRWDGQNTAGSGVASGVYFYYLQAGSFHESKKMLLLK